MNPRLLITTICCLSLSPSSTTQAQNINGFRITVGRDAPAYLVFNDEVKSFEFNSTDGYKFYDIIRRSGNALSIAFRQPDGETPPPQLSIVMEGKRTHSFQIQFDDKYDINKSPQLFYDYSDLKDLRQLIAQNKSEPTGTTPVTNDDDLKRKQIEEQKALAEAKAQKETNAAAKKKEAEAMAKKAALEEKQRMQELERLKAEQAKLEAEQKKAQLLAQQEEQRLKKQQEEEAKQAALQAKKDEEARKQKEEEQRKRKEQQQREDERTAAQKAKEEEAKQQELQRIKDEKERRIKKEEHEKALALQQQKEADLRKKEEQRLAAAKAAEEEKQKIAEEKKRQAEEQRALQRQKDEEALKRKQEELARKKAEEEATALRLKELEAEKARAEKEQQYSAAGLWERYGRKGINLFDLPPEQHQYNNAEFYLEGDTLRHYEVSQAMIADHSQTITDVRSNTVKKVTATLQNIRLENGSVFYELLVDNQSEDDFLQGAMAMYWYDQNHQPKKWINCSYYTYISGLNIIPPTSSSTIVFATRLITIPQEDQLVLLLEDRRYPNEKMNLVISGKLYNQEIAKSAIKDDQAIPKTENDEQKTKRKRTKK